MANELIVVILAGGHGTRLWPLSGAAEPKYLLRLAEGKSLLAATIERALALTQSDNIYVVCGRDQSQELGRICSLYSVERLVVEPTRKDTGPALALAVGRIRDSHGEEVTIVSLPADHVVGGGALWAESIRAAVGAAVRDSCLVCLGKLPDRPSEDFGYMVLGGELVDKVAEVAEFVEKPSRDAAQAYIANGGVLWNTAIMAFTCRTFIDLIELVCPSLMLAVDIGAGLRSPEEWAGMMAVAIDYAILEPGAARGMIKALAIDYEWLDVGSWQTLLSARFVADLARIGLSVQMHEVERSYCVSRASRRVLIVDAPGILVVEAEEGLLVIGLNSLDKMKAAVSRFHSPPAG